MAPKKKRQHRTSTLKRHDAVRKEFNKWIDKKEDGVRKYTHDYILRQVAAKFYLEPGTVENIVFNRV